MTLNDLCARPGNSKTGRGMWTKRKNYDWLMSDRDAWRKITHQPQKLKHVDDADDDVMYRVCREHLKTEVMDDDREPFSAELADISHYSQVLCYGLTDRDWPYIAGL